MNLKKIAILALTYNLLQFWKNINIFYINIYPIFGYINIYTKPISYNLHSWNMWVSVSECACK